MSKSFGAFYIPLFVLSVLMLSMSIYAKTATELASPTFDSNILIPITLATGNSIDTPIYQQAERVLSAAFQKIGYKLKIKSLPNKRSLSWANSGKVDGEMFRVSDLNLTKLPNLVRITEPLLTIDQTVLSKKNIKVNGWNSLLNYSIAFERGTAFLEKKQHYFKHVFLVNSTEQALAMIYNDRADLTVTSIGTAQKLLNKDPKYAETINIIYPPLVHIDLHVYLNRISHKKLGIELSKTLRKMKKTGEFSRLIELTN